MALYPVQHLIPCYWRKFERSKYMKCRGSKKGAATFKFLLAYIYASLPLFWMFRKLEKPLGNLRSGGFSLDFVGHWEGAECQREDKD